MNRKATLSATREDLNIGAQTAFQPDGDASKPSWQMAATLRPGSDGGFFL